MDHPEIRKEHDDFIEKILVPFYINQIESLRFSDKTMTIHPIGKASSTGDAMHNMQLSIARAQNIGKSIKKHFDSQKARGVFANKIEVKVDAKGEGDQDERKRLGTNINKISPKLLDSKSGAFRSVLMSMRLRHIVVDDDEKIVCRQILNLKLKRENVPSNLLEQKLDELQQRIPPEIAAFSKESFNTLKAKVKVFIEDVLKAAEFTAPEIFLFFKLIEFIVPSDIALIFEFKDARGRSQHYNFSGSANKIDLNLIEVISQLLSVLNWLKKTPEKLDELEKRIDQEGNLTRIPPTQLEKLKATIREMKIFAGRAKSAFDALTARGSIFRRLVGDAIADFIIAAIDKGSGAVLGPVQIATEFETVHFERKGLFDVGSFGGVARTETEERIGTATTVALDFAARSNQSLLGFQGHVIMKRQFSISLTLASHEQSNGVLRPVPPPSLA